MGLNLVRVEDLRQVLDVDDRLAVAIVLLFLSVLRLLYANSGES